MAHKTQPEWIHTPGDGRGARLVFCAGILRNFVTYADTRRGFVRVVKDGNPLVHETIKGHVTVIPHP